MDWSLAAWLVICIGSGVVVAQEATSKTISILPLVIFIGSLIMVLVRVF